MTRIRVKIEFAVIPVVYGLKTCKQEITSCLISNVMLIIVVGFPKLSLRKLIFFCRKNFNKKKKKFNIKSSYKRKKFFCYNLIIFIYEKVGLISTLIKYHLLYSQGIIAFINQFSCCWGKISLFSFMDFFYFFLD